MKKIQLYFIVFAFLMLGACGGKETQSETTTSEETNSLAESKDDNAIKNIALDDTKLKNYIETIKKLKEKGADFSEDVNALNGLFKYKEMEGLVQEGGFKDFNDFILVHSKIAYALMVNEMKEQDIENKVKDEQKKTTEELEKSLNDPNISEEQKKMIQQTIEQVKGMENIGSQIQSATGMYKNMVSDDDVAIVKKYSEALKKVYENNQ
ncbi:MAG: hypothetical protein MUE81_10870 [Thermoflexibacter sp.]|jgi:major membrane immunogen (membrane-anchored lipoprotein)|nr:hypothetical protein [Thermoflexibacter sp.]